LIPHASSLEQPNHWPVGFFNEPPHLAEQGLSVFGKAAQATKDIEG
jgi:hypothetical protein